MDKIGVIVLSIALMTIMLGMGLSLTLDDFKRVLRCPKATLTGLVNQIILLPLVGFSLANVMGVSPDVAVGVMILAASPGGATSNLITHLARGDIALSVSLTAVSSTITVFTIPFIVQFAQSFFLGDAQRVVLNIPKMIQQLVIITVIPVAVGMFVRKTSFNFAKKMEKPVRIASAMVLAFVIIALAIKEKDSIVSYLQEVGLIVLALNIITLFLGFITAKIMRLSPAQATSISIESGIQNGTLAITIATVTMQNPTFGIPAGMYSLIMFLTGFLIVYFSNKKIIFTEKET